MVRTLIIDYYYRFFKKTITIAVRSLFTFIGVWSFRIKVFKRRYNEIIKLYILKKIVCLFFFINIGNKQIKSLSPEAQEQILNTGLTNISRDILHDIKFFEI